MLRSIVSAVAVGFAVAIGCGVNPEGPPLAGGPPDAAAVPGSEDAACTATAALPSPIDPSTLPSCCTSGAAHCVPAADVAPSIVQQLAPCAGGYCEPDPSIQNPAFVPATCQSLNNAPGACVSVCVPEVMQYLSILPQATCASDERCAPCINPLDNSVTGACNVGKSTGGCGQADAGGAASPGEGGGGVCPYTGPPIIDPTTFPACTPACSGSHCVPASLVPAAQQSELVSCTSSGGAPGYCAPDSLTESGGNGLPPSCTSIAGSEGRCLSVCIPQVASEEAVLPQATCAQTERCAPCFNPTAADPTAPTGACSIACDAPTMPPTILPCPYTGPPVLDPTVFPACSPACGGAHCVPAALVPAAQQSELAACPGGFCTPDSLSSSGGKAVPATCTSIGGAEGRCLSECLPIVASNESVLPPATCAGGELCAPCFNPTAADPTAPTGACSIACDKPADPPTVLTCPWTGPPVVNPSVFPACAPACSGAHCVPAALVPASQQAELTACPGGYCAPDPITASDDNYVPPTCQPFADPASEGRCTSDCLPSVQAQSSELVQATCASGDLCAPCTNPFDGTSTGACNLACDHPTKPPFTFPLCCSFDGQDQGTCLPKNLVPSAQQGSLEQDICPTNAASYLCVPDEYLPNSPYPVQTCNAGLLGSGACVSKCANITLGGVGLSQGTCPANHLCVPCSLAPAGTPGCSTADQ